MAKYPNRHTSHMPKDVKVVGIGLLAIGISSGVVVLGIPTLILLLAFPQLLFVIVALVILVVGGYIKGRC